MINQPDEFLLFSIYSLQCFRQNKHNSDIINLNNSLYYVLVCISQHVFLLADVSVSNHAILAQFCKEHHVGLVVVGPEVPLAAGM